MQNLNPVGNEKIIPCTLDNISQFTIKQSVKSKSEDMQSVAKHPAYLHHNVLQRGDYHN